MPLVELSIIIDFDKCEKFNPLTIYPIVLNPQMRYYLFTSDNLLEGEEILDQNVTSFVESKFNKEWPTRIFISGWKTTPQNCKTALIKDAYYRIGNVNFIVADWSDWNKREYALASTSVNGVGRLIGKFINFLNSNGISYDNIYIIGHSLGAHVAGAVGDFIQPHKINTIYGLDPAGIGFIGLLPQYRLSPNDATYVEVIITDMFGFGYGSEIPLGQAQLYPHFGRRYQPSCSSLNLNDQFCSHGIAVDYFVNSLNEDLEFCALPTTFSNILLSVVPQNSDICDFVMGGDPSIPKNGTFFVPVSSGGPLPP
ncbi:endothelial lipase-like [Condylostylus longicornis]|uniref:endothelial lipase-like n=1 Tax=Condylostylus longicornis TaxID=2530218 RepID=UPI00244DE807|nr:endothelial lipase-like [Condylostylus longicornis]